MIKEFGIHKGQVVYDSEKHSVIECEYCEFKHVIPLPEQEELNKLYGEEYYEKAQPQYINRVKQDQEWWSEVYKERAVTIENFFESGKALNALDIGSGPGYFLVEGKKRGWNTLGIEPSMQAYDYSKSLGLDVINGFFSEELATELDQFDIIHMNHVLEHLPSPKQTIELMRSKLKVNGILCIAVPNDFNVFQELLHSSYNYKPWWVSPQEHLNYFSFNSLKKLLNENGFDVMKETTSFPMELFLLMGDNFIGNDQLGRQCHRKRVNFEMSLLKNNLQEVKSVFYEGLAKNGLGRDVILFARKL
ncbi:class I SAM-dependent methyltransferase [Bacillus sp. FJAT-42315]|uniref:class I SAM-dependent methyltransferase n=1 Tax=Bacillus sp. FJAT-42315 TaxID=2014077 RepID=UPI0012FEB3BD|nr:class I SAM-dependent methyltransferase [Bacillus sp. FJAT-42315]